MANWDDAQLAEVVERRHGEENKKKYATQIVSKIFDVSLALFPSIIGMQIFSRSCREQYVRLVLELS